MWYNKIHKLEVMGHIVTVEEILSLIQGLSPTEQSRLMTVLTDDSSKASKLEQLLTESRFSRGLICHLCGCIDHISRNGHRKDGKQRYICKDCGRTFVANTNSITLKLTKHSSLYHTYHTRGNHKKGPFMLPRAAHKRGKSIHTRGLSKKQVCVPCAIDRSSHAVSKIATLGRVKTKDLHLLYDGKISEEATLCTDKMNSYVRFESKSRAVKIRQIKEGYL